MKYSLVADIHAQNTNLDKVGKVFDLVEDLGNPVIILGDLLHTKAIMSVGFLYHL
jgi:hypothetical protein